MTGLVRFSVLALALVGFTASTVVSHSEAATRTAKAGKLGAVTGMVNPCRPNGGCQIDY